MILSEILPVPADYYPKLKQYSRLAGNHANAANEEERTRLFLWPDPFYIELHCPI